MSKVEEIVAVRATPAQVMRTLVTVARFDEWTAPDVTLTAHTRAVTLSPGDRLQLQVLGGATFDYVVEGASDRELVFSFTGPWSGEERWSIIADGAETLVRRVYDVRDTHGLTGLAWPTVGRALVMAHFKLELARFRDVVERSPGPAGEIEGGVSPGEIRTTYEVDEG